MKTNLAQQAIQDNANNDFLQGDTVVRLAHQNALQDFGKWFS